MRKALPLLLTLLFMLVGCGGPSEAEVQATVQAAVQATSVAATAAAVANTCDKEDLTAYADAVEKKMDRFVQQADLTGATSRVGMAAPMQRLLDLELETEDLNTPKCLLIYHALVRNAMEFYRLGYQTFSAQGDETQVQALIMLGQDEMKKRRDELITIRAGKVPELPKATPTPVKK